MPIEFIKWGDKLLAINSNPLYYSQTPGSQGVQGTQGTEGVQGTQGIQGVEGSQGTIGSQGTEGAQGLAGIQGAEGTQGTLGTQGTQGTQGLIGIQGTIGIQGLAGIQGVQGTSFSDASLALYVKKAGDTMTGDLTITGAVISNASIGYKTSAYTARINDCNGIIEASGTFNVTLPNNMPVGYQTTIVNMGPGVITLNASTLYATDSSVALRNQYAGASAYHKGSGIWVAFGNLK